MRKTFRYRLSPTPAQARALWFALDECRWLYNHLLAQRKTAWETEHGVSASTTSTPRFPP